MKATAATRSSWKLFQN